MNPPKPTFHDAVIDLGRAVLDALHIPQLVDWLERKLSGGRS